MFTFQTFDQLHSGLGFLVILLFLFVYPIKGGDTTGFKAVLLVGMLIAVMIPFLVETKPEENEKLVMRSGKIVHTFVFVLFFYCIVYKDLLLKYKPYFFWLCYSLALYSLFELLLVDVLLAAKYQNGKLLGSWLAEHFQIKTFDFTAFLNYLIKFVFIPLFLKDSVQNFTFKKVFQYLMWMLVIFELIQLLIFKSYQGYDSLSSTVKNLFFLFGAGLLLYRIYINASVSLSLNKNPYFWICLGLISPALSELFLELVFSKLYQTDPSSFYRLYLIRNASQIVGLTLLIVGVWQAKYLRFLPKEY